MVIPPSREAWRIDAELNGHTVEQTIRYLSDCDDAAGAQQERQRALPPTVISSDGVEPRWLGMVRRWFGSR